MQNIKSLIFVLFFGLILLLPFHTPLTVWLGTSYGNLYIWSAWKEIVVLLICLISLLVLFKKHSLKLLFKPIYNKLAIIYILCLLIYLLLNLGDLVTWVGFAINVRFIAIFLFIQVLYLYIPRHRETLSKIIVYSGLILVILSIIQLLILPNNFLVNLGYDQEGLDTVGVPPSSHRVAPGSSLIRAQSTMRGPNVLGAYLILPAFLALYLYKKSRETKYIAIMSIVILGILLTYSRSAWIGLFIGLVISMLLVPKYINLLKKHRAKGLIISVAALATIPFIWNNYYFQKIVLHENPSVEGIQSNEGHIQLSYQALNEVIESPLGKGLGSAGPSSTLDNSGDARIAENYFLQVGQEIGWIGFMILVMLHITILLRLWKYKKDDFILPVLLSFIGITFTNLLLHTWSDEVVSITMWSMLGIAVASTTRRESLKAD